MSQDDWDWESSSHAQSYVDQNEGAEYTEEGNVAEVGATDADDAADEGESTAREDDNSRSNSGRPLSDDESSDPHSVEAADTNEPLPAEGTLASPIKVDDMPTNTPGEPKEVIHIEDAELAVEQMEEAPQVPLDSSIPSDGESKSRTSRRSTGKEDMPEDGAEEGDDQPNIPPRDPSINGEDELVEEKDSDDVDERAEDDGDSANSVSDDGGEAHTEGSGTSQENDSAPAISPTDPLSAGSDHDGQDDVDPLPDFPDAVSDEEPWMDEDQPPATTPEGSEVATGKKKKRGLFGFGWGRGNKEEAKGKETEEEKKTESEDNHETELVSKDNTLSGQEGGDAIPTNPFGSDQVNGEPAIGETFQDEPETEDNLVKNEWAQQDDEDYGDDTQDRGEAPSPFVDPEMQISEVQDPTGQDDEYRSIATEEEGWADESKATSRWSSIEATKERKIITCLTLLVCCLCMLFVLGIGIGIGAAIGSDDEKIIKAPPTPSPTMMPVETAAPSMSPSLPITPSPSQSPSFASQAPSSNPSVDPLLEFLVESSFDEGVQLRSAGTPQRSAYEWLRNNAGLDTFTDEQKLQRYALATFFYATNGPTSWEESIRSDGWLTDANECEWGSSTEGGQCTDGVYTNLSLDFEGVGGALPLEIGLLSGLTRLSLRGVDNGNIHLNGELPTTIGLLVNLESLRLDGNRIRGSIPTEIGLMTNLRLAFLSGNAIGGQIPTEIGNIIGTQLLLDSNELGGAIPSELFQLSEMTTLSLENNFLSGPIPTEIGNLGSLNTLNLAINDLTGTIPTEVGLLSAIRTGINLSDNDLEGPLPSQIGFLQGMREFEVQKNKLTGEVPLTYVFLSSIRRFRIDDNGGITGSISPDLCATFLGEPITVSYSDCALPTFECECCTFCCEEGFCECTSFDTELCDAEEE